MFDFTPALGYNSPRDAEVAEWQTRRSQKPLRATSCGFNSTFGTIRYNGKQYLGAWLSLVERSVRVAEVGGSNPLAPTKPAGCKSLGE